MAKPTLCLDPFSMTNDQIMKKVYETHIPGDENYDVESLLNVAENIIKHSTQIADTYLKGTNESIEFAKNKPLPEGLTLPLSKIKQIGYQMTCQLAHDQDHAHQTTMAILYELRRYNWGAKAAITLAAFAMEYGNFWHLAEIQATTALGKSLALLNGGSIMNRLQDIEIQRPTFDEFSNLVKMVLQVIEYIIELKNLSKIGYDQAGEVPELFEAIQEIPVDVYWIIITIVICATHIGFLLGDSKYKPELCQYAEKLKSVLTNLTEHVAKIRKKIDAAVSQKTDSSSTENKETNPNIYFGQKKNNFSYEKRGIDSTDIDAPAQPSNIVYPLGRNSFPEDFIFGTATSAYQIEGAVKKRGPSAWDNFTHNYPEKIKDRSNGDVACDSYNLYKEDIRLMKEMNTDAYRFSISWSRILPNGKLSGGVNQEGIDHYKRLIKDLKDNGLIPFVTLFHVNRPQALEDKYDGFLNDCIVDDFKNFADLCFENFGDRVKHWITLNEPHIYCYTGYVDGTFAPGRIGDPGKDPYDVAHNLLRAHAAAVEVYKTKYKASQNGVIGITLDSLWTVPYSKDDLDRDAAFRALDFWLGWFMEPLKTGDYPETMKSRVGERLREFSTEESKQLIGSFDFIGINYYTSMFAANYATQNDPPSYTTDSGVHLTYWSGGSAIGERTASGMYSYPKGLRDLLCYVQEKYDDPLIYITENGVATFNEPGLPLQGALLDVPRVRFHNEHLYFILSAIKNDGVNVKGYFVWSLLDNFEWSQGYTMRFGMNFVDYENDTERNPKLSAQWFKLFLKN